MSSDGSNSSDGSTVDEDNAPPPPESPFDGELDPTTSIGQKLYAIAVKPLATLYTGGGNSPFANFITDVRAHVTECRLAAIMEIPVGHNPDGSIKTKSLLEEPRLITVQQVLDARDARNEGPRTHDNYRARTNSSMLYNFLRRSIDGPLKTHVSNRMTTYKENDGPLYYKIIHEHEVGLANTAAVRISKNKLRSMTLGGYNNDVKNMHHAIRAELLILAANGDTPDNMQHILLNAYKNSSNSEFQQFANHVSNDLDNGAVMDIPTLMERAATKYDGLVAEGKWAGDKRDAQILALNTQIRELKGNAGGSRGRQNNPNKSRTVDDSKIPAWKKVAPGEGEPPTKFMQAKNRDGSSVNKEHFWCSVHRDGKGLWCTHNPKDCKMQQGQNSPGKRNPVTPEPNSASKHNNNRSSKKPKLVSNNATIAVAPPKKDQTEYSTDEEDYTSDERTGKRTNYLSDEE